MNPSLQILIMNREAGGSREGTQTGAGDFLISNTSITSQINIQWKQVSAARKVLQREISHFVIFC